jgi:site-specific recombinase XerD
VPPKFKRLPIGQPTKPYLNAKEIKMLEELELTGTDEEIRDRYIVNLFTGLRISDMKNLVIDKVDHNIINFKATQKTGAPVSIPIATPVRKMLNKYNGQFPPQHNEVYVNRRIKVICKKAGIIKPIELKVSEMSIQLKTRLIKEGFMNGNEATVKIPKNELITNHTARRSMTTNMLRSGIPINKARKITGMSIKTLERYDKVTPEENAQDLQSHAFFAQ